MKKYIVLMALPFLLAGCPGKNSNNTPGVITTGIAPGAYAMAGTVTTISPNCASTIATVTVSTYTGYGSGSVIGSAQVNTGGAFNIAVSAGTYTLSVVAGQCQVSQAVQAITSGQPPYSVCLGSSCTLTNTCTYPYYCKASATSTTHGSIGTKLPGNGDLQIDSANIYLSAAKVTPFDLNVELSSGNDLLNSVPSLGSGWNGSVAGDGSLKVGEASVDHLSYSAQVDASLLQYDQGFCDTSSGAVAKIAEYLKQSGFNSKAVQGLQSAWTEASVADKVCVYPQDATTVERVAAYKGDSKINANRIWFIVVPENQQAKLKKSSSEKLAKLSSGPKTDALAALKKADAHRQIASDSDILADEWALGFVIQK